MNNWFGSVRDKQESACCYTDGWRERLGASKSEERLNFEHVDVVGIRSGRWCGSSRRWERVYC